MSRGALERGVMGRVAKTTAIASIMFCAFLSGMPVADAGGSATGEGRLSFQSDGGLWVTDADGTDEFPVPGACEGYESSWRPRTEMIAFIHRCGPSGSFDVSAINTDGSGLVHLLATAADDSGPDWSADGARLTLTSDQTGNRDVYVMNADGSGLVNLTNNPAHDEYPAFSPDGSQIAFTSDRSGNFELYLMNDDGSGLRRLTFDPANDGATATGGGPSWSPDGRWVAFESDRAGNLDIYRINIPLRASSRAIPLTRHAATDLNPSWSPDGRLIAFSSDRSGNFEIYTMRASGANVTPVTNRPFNNDYQPDWATP